MSTATTTKTDKKSAWKKAGVHTVALPSGMEVDVRIPNLPLMIKQGSIPNNLIQTALGVMDNQSITAELLSEQADFFHMLVASMVVEPELTPEEVPEVVPYEDIELLAELATRQRDVDALGHHIGGLHTSKDWRVFRGLEDRD